MCNIRILVFFLFWINFIQVCMAEKLTPHVSQLEQKMDNSDIRKPAVTKRDVIALFEIATRQDDEEQLATAVNALAGVSWRVDLYQQNLEGGRSIGDRLADKIGKNAKNWPQLMLRFAMQFHKLEMNSHARQRILAMLLATALNQHDDTTTQAILKLVPYQPTNPILAYNLASLGALKHERARMLEFTRIALRLGKPAQQFRDDKDFEPYLSDKEFVKLLDETRARHTPFVQAVYDTIDSGNLQEFNRLLSMADEKGYSLVIRDQYMLCVALARKSLQDNNRDDAINYFRLAKHWASGWGKSSLFEQLKKDREFSPYFRDKQFVALVDEKLQQGNSVWDKFDGQYTEEKQRSILWDDVIDVKYRAIKGGSYEIFLRIYSDTKERYPTAPFDRGKILTEAVKYRQHKIVDVFLEDPIQLQAENVYNQVMEMAIMNNDAKMVLLLKDKGIPFDYKQEVAPSDYAISKMTGRDTTEYEVSQGFIYALKVDADEVVKAILAQSSGVRIMERKKYVKALQYFLSKHGHLTSQMTDTLLENGISKADMRDQRRDR